MKAIWFLVFIIILQQIESNVIYPRIMGQQIGLPSLWVLVSVILGGEFFGIAGIIISVPLCSVFYTLLHGWILKRLRDKKLCKQNAVHIPNEIKQLTDEEFLSDAPDEEEPVTELRQEKTNARKSKVKITQQNTKSSNSKKKKGKKSSKK